MNENITKELVLSMERLEANMMAMIQRIQDLRNDSLDSRTTVQQIVRSQQDSMTIGTPGNGQIKVYGDADRPEDFQRRINNMKKTLAENNAK